MAKLEILEGVRDVPREQWNALLGDEASPFLEWEWLSALEEAGCLEGRCGWGPRPLVLREAGRLVAACPMYLKANSEGEFVFDHGWARAAEDAGIAYYPKLLVGVPFTPVSGARFLTAPGEDRGVLAATLADALVGICKESKLSGVHVNFCLEDERRVLSDAGWLPRLGMQYHWRNENFGSFEDYLAGLRSKRRNQARRELRSLQEQGVRIKRLHGESLDAASFETMFEVYLETIRNNPWGRQYLNKRFFELLGERFRHRMVFVAAHLEGRVIAGAVNVQKGDALYGRYWGAFEPLRNLHFNVCYYAGIEHCIENDLARFEPGAGGNYKQLRGFDATPTWSCHYLDEPRLFEAVRHYLQRERAEAGDAIDWYRGRTARRRGARE